MFTKCTRSTCCSLNVLGRSYVGLTYCLSTSPDVRGGILTPFTFGYHSATVCTMLLLCFSFQPCCLHRRRPVPRHRDRQLEDGAVHRRGDPHRRDHPNQNSLQQGDRSDQEGSRSGTWTLAVVMFPRCWEFRAKFRVRQPNFRLIYSSVFASRMEWFCSFNKPAVLTRK